MRAHTMASRRARAPPPLVSAALLATALGALSARGARAAPCADDHTSCADWARAGECPRNPEYMYTYCTRSCGRCKGKMGVAQVHAVQQGFSRPVRTSWQAGREAALAERAGDAEAGVHRAMRRKHVSTKRLRRHWNLLSPEERDAIHAAEEEEEAAARESDAAEAAAVLQRRARLAAADAARRGGGAGGAGAPAPEPDEPASEGLFDWVEPRHIVWLFELSGLCQCASHALQLWGARTAPASLCAVSGKTLGMQLAAVLARSVFCAVSHFGQHWVVRLELPAAAVLLLLLMRAHARRPAQLSRVSSAAVEPGRLRGGGGGGALGEGGGGAEGGSHLAAPRAAAGGARASPEQASAWASASALGGGLGARRAAAAAAAAASTGVGVHAAEAGGVLPGGVASPSPSAGTLPAPVSGASASASADGSFPAVRVCVACAALAATLSTVTRYPPLTYASIGASIFIEAAALVPQRRLLLATARVSALTGHAVLLLALSRAVRLLMWAVLYHEGDTQHALMAADALHCVMLGRFVHAYVRLLIPRVVVPT